MSLVERLRAALPPGLALGDADPRAPETGLWPAERAATTRMRAPRRREFAAGRRAARAAMAELGLPLAAIPMAADRAPLWPEGVIGTISHDDENCLAVIGRRADWAGLGLDLEPALPLPEDLVATICDPGEAADAQAARAIFCAKEASYKAISHRIDRVPGFLDMRVRLGPEDRFTAHLGPGFAPHDKGLRIEGMILRTPAQLAALVCLAAT